ncbi:NfeD family protein [Lignipirellula cremea]|uniref:Uncharacterized protein n=1 Tax=Lignipirellula cremea TaxID=2528010 RepID=A0A518E3H9_9BACT|nr:NfeD family protein [Lignipirellula cremea]QDU98648.1 hypothetical protein Pla8534_65200 [Lignipirellula cremea]
MFFFTLGYKMRHMLLASVWLVSASLASADGPPYEHPVLIRFDGDITPQRMQYLFRKLDLAEGQGADLLIVEIDSPGGYMNESLEMADRLASIRWAHTVAYVPHEAISGGAIMALGCDEIVMGPNAQIGDAGAIEIGAFVINHAPEKTRSYLAAKLRGLCEAKNRPPALGEAMCDFNLVVYRMRNQETGDLRLLSQPEIDELPDPAQWEKVSEVAESRAGSFLTLSGRRALELGLTEGVVDTRAALYQRFELTKDPRVLQPTAVDVAIPWLNWWPVTWLLIAVGLIALFVELSAPGISIGGLISGLCFALFFWSRFLGGTAGWLEVVLFVSGLAFLAIELFVLPGFGVAGVLGLGMLVASMIFAGQDFWIPNNSQEVVVTTTSVVTLLGAGATFLVAAFFISRNLGSLPVFNHLVLRPPTADEVLPAADEKESKGQVQAHGSAYQVGDWGVAISPLRPAGKIEVGDTLLDVTSEGGFIEHGAQVKIVQIRGNRIVVREV